MIFLSILLSLSVAADKPTCSAKSVTKDCSFFKDRSDKAEIRLEDGSSFPNPLYQTTSLSLQGMIPQQSGGLYGTMSGQGTGYPGSSPEFDDYMETQAQFLSILNGSKIPLRNQLALLPQFTNLFSADSSISTPWPLLDSKAYIQSIKSSEFKKELEKALGPQKMRLLQSLIDKKKITYEKINLQQKQMVERQEQEQKLAKQKENDFKDARKKKLEELFKFAKTSVIDTLVRGKPETEWTADEKLMVEKIGNLPVKIESKELPSANCASDLTNAFYSPVNLNITVCSGAAFLPNAMLLHILAHEIGHSIDPCSFNMGIWSIDQPKLKSFITSATDLSERDKVQLNSYASQANNKTGYDPDLAFDDPNLLKVLTEKGIFKSLPSVSRQQKYPFHSEYTCLVEKAKFREIESKDIQDMEANLKEEFSRFDSKLDNEGREAIKLTIQRYKKAMTRYPQCLSSQSGESQMGETMSDVLASVAVEKYLLQNPPRTEEQKVGSVIFISRTCSFDNSKPKSLSPLTTAALGKALKDPHPEYSLRVSNLILNLPGMSEMYNCERKTPQCFDNLSTYSSQGRPKSSNSSQGVQ